MSTSSTPPLRPRGPLERRGSRAAADAEKVRLSASERRCLGRLATLFGRPDELTRLLALYRAVRAPGEPIDGEIDGEHHAAAFLLALSIADARLASELLRRLIEAPWDAPAAESVESPFGGLVELDDLLGEPAELLREELGSLTAAEMRAAVRRVAPFVCLRP